MAQRPGGLCRRGASDLRHTLPEPAAGACGRSSAQSAVGGRRSLALGPEPGDQHFLLPRCKVCAADCAVVEHRQRHPRSDVGRVGSRRRIASIKCPCVGFCHVGDRTAVQGRQDHFVGCDVPSRRLPDAAAKRCGPARRSRPVALHSQFQHDRADSQRGRRSVLVEKLLGGEIFAYESNGRLRLAAPQFHRGMDRVVIINDRDRAIRSCWVAIAVLLPRRAADGHTG